MKQLLCLVIVICIVILLPIPVFGSAADMQTTGTEDFEIIYQTIEWLDDDTYQVITLAQNTTPSYSPFRATSSTSGSKTCTAYNSSHEKLYEFSVIGSFTYTGSSSSCTSAAISEVIYLSSWSVESKSSSKSGNSAIGNWTFIRKMLFIIVETQEPSLTLSCDKNGDLH